MPGKIKVKILAGRNLPVMDRSGDTTDAYVEIKFGNTTYKTDVCRKSLNPQWNSEWYRFEVDDAELQDEPLQVRLMDHDTYSANDAIGKVYVNLNPLLLPGLPPTVKNIWTLEATMNSSIGSQGGSVMTGWIPVFDTMHGIRGEVNIIVKVELFSDCNKFRQSSCGVQFFYSPNIPHGYHAQVIHGFVEELVVSDDPEYKWIDKIRTPRASNEARQTLFFKLSGEVQRKIGLKALDLGGNAVIGYVQNFDLEGESGIVARGIGTAVTLVKLQDISSILPIETSNIEDLTSFGLQSKNLYDLSESDDSLPLLSQSPKLTASVSCSPTSLYPTSVSNRFPRHHRTSSRRRDVRVSEYRAPSLISRQHSLQHSPIGNNSMRKGAVSSLSIGDDLISESSLMNMLALEDMRGEPASNPFSRSLKNFRYLHKNILPRRVAEIKSKITDSFDDESDQESACSSTWSLAGSESNRSPSIADLRQSMRRKKFTHKKNSKDGIAAMLIRSVHSGFPLDSVREDRETPTPSPVNLLDDRQDYGDDRLRSVAIGKDSEGIPDSNEESTSSQLEDNCSESKILLGKRKKRDVKYTSEHAIPMMSSSETDTSTSDEEPSESSTNYNILDDSCAIVDPESPDEIKSARSPRRATNTGTRTDFPGKIVTRSVEKGETTIDDTKEENRYVAETIDEHFETNTNYDILDDSCAIVDPGSVNEIKSARSPRRTTNTGLTDFPGKIVTRLVEKGDTWIDDTKEENRYVAETIDEHFESSTNYDILDDSCAIVGPASTDEMKSARSPRRATNTGTVTDFPVKIAMRLVEKGETRIDDTKEEDRYFTETIDEHFESSTDYNILEDSCLIVVANSIDDSEYEANLKRLIPDAKIGGIFDKNDLFEHSEKMESSTIKPTHYIDSLSVSQVDKKIEKNSQDSSKDVLYTEDNKMDLLKTSEKIEASSIKPTDDQNLVTVSQADEKFETNLQHSMKVSSSSEDEMHICQSLEKVEVSEPELSDNKNLVLALQADEKFEDNIQPSIEVLSCMENKSNIFEGLKKNEGSKNRSSDDKNNVSIAQTDPAVESNYNIFCDAYSLVDSSSPDDEKSVSEFRRAVEMAEFHDTPVKIDEISARRNEFAIDAADSANRPSTARPDENIQSISDDCIANENDPPMDQDLIDVLEPSEISSSRPTIVSVVFKKVDKEFEKIEKAKVDPTNEKNRLIVSRSDEKEIEGDVKVLEDTFFKHVDNLSGKNENSSFVSQADEIFKSSIDSYIIDDTSSSIDRSSLDRKDFDIIIERTMGVSRDPDLSSEKIEEPSVKQERMKIDRTGQENAMPTMLRDCHSISSTNYHFLDGPSSPIEGGTIDVEKIEEIEGFEIANSFKIQSDPESISPNKWTVENVETRESMEIEPEIGDTLSISQSDENFKSSTDDNILDDPSLIEPISLDDWISNSSLRQAMDFVKIAETVTSSKSDRSSEKSADIVIEREIKENKSLLCLADKSNIFATLPISPNHKEHTFDRPPSRSVSPLSRSSGSTKLKQLKFLPKQMSFDSSEDPGFVTSTPVEIDPSIIPDFDPKENSSPRRSFQSMKFEHRTPIVSGDKRSETDFDVSEQRSFSKVCPDGDRSSIEKKIGDRPDRQTCPLGLSLDKITKANQIKIAKSSNPFEINRSESVDLSRSPTSSSPQKSADLSDGKGLTGKKDRSKKIERTDTVIYKGPAKDRFVVPKTTKSPNTARPANPIPIVVAPPPEEHATRLQVPVIRTTNINVQSTFSPDEMKTQHFGSIGSRKFPIDDRAFGEKFGRKYRQHCMLDLIRTIDAKMMIHHAHHDRHDSTKSRRKKRDRLNASATPSPDSIHRTKSHRRRSRSRSPERPHSHAKNQISSLTTHSFPNSATPSLRSPSPNPQQDGPSCDSSYENLSRLNTNPPIIMCTSNDSNAAAKENEISLANDDRPDDRTTSRQLTAADGAPAETAAGDYLSAELKVGLEFGETPTSLLVPNDIEHPVFKSHSAGSLERLRESFPQITNITNDSNTIDDLCVPRSPLTPRQPDEQPQQSSSPVQSASALPSSLGSKVGTANSTAATKTNNAVPNMHRRSSDSDLSITPKGNSLAGSDRSMGGHMRPSTAIVRTMNQDTMEMLEYPFITMQQYPAGFVLNIGGLVSARSVKLLERITNLEEPEGRDAWWTEIRMEVRSHARALACNVVLGYKEEISICDDVCVLNASGTAAVINLLNSSQDQDSILLSRTIMTTSVESEREAKCQVKSSNTKSDKSEDNSTSGQAGKVKRTSESNEYEIPYLPTLSACSLCHLPYNEASVPFRVDVTKCAICRRAKVPDVLFTTIELPENIPMTGRGIFLQATVCKSKRDLRGELNAKEISDCLPFLEYELHSLLLNKLKVKGMNAIFGLKVQVSVGERLVIGMAVGTAVYLTALPAPSVPKIASGNSWHNEEQLAEIQKTLIETVKKNREFYRLKPIIETENGRSITTSDTEESDDDLPDLDLGIGTKDACVLEVDDVEDMDRINLLIDERPPDDFHVVNTQTIPGLEDLEIVRNLQMFTQISRAKIPAGQFASMPSKYFARMLQTVLFKLRRMVPCALCDMQFKVALSDQDEIQLSVVGMALGLGEPTRFSKYKRKIIPNSTSKDPVKRTDENDMIFSLDEDQADNTTAINQEPVANQPTTNPSNSSPMTGTSAQRHRTRSPFRTRSHVQHRHKHVPLKERYGVDITPLSYLPGGKIERYLGNLNFFFIRESTSIRENGGLSGFTHSFVTEILAIVRAHITALGGNAMVAFFMTQCVLLHSPHKNQGQSLINVGGDVVTVSYYGNDKYQGSQNC